MRQTIGALLKSRSAGSSFILTGKSDTDQLKIDAIVVNEAMIKTYRQRLTDLSWLMKSISEPIARRANAEDKVNGRFWQG